MMTAMGEDAPGDRETPLAEIRRWRGALRLSAVGMTLALCIAVPAIIGHLLDARYQTEPWLTITGFALGTVGGFVELVREVRRAERNDG